MKGGIWGDTLTERVTELSHIYLAAHGGMNTETE